MTTTTITPNLTTFLEDLKSADLVGISLNPQNLGLHLDFTFGPEFDDAVIELYPIVHLVLSQPLNPDDEEICFWVGEVELKKIEKNAPEILSALSYPFQDQNGTINANSSSLIYFRLEGDICLEVICVNYKTFQKSKN
jgi:hypothetical protein